MMNKGYRNRIAFRTFVYPVILLLWPWPWPSDLDIRIWPRYSEDVPAASHCDKYINTLSIHSYAVKELRSVHLKCNLFTFSSISAEYLQKIWIF